MMLVFGVEPMEVVEGKFDYLEYPVVMEPEKPKKKGKSAKQKEEKKPKTKDKPAKKKRGKNVDLADFSLDDLSMTDLQLTTFTAAVSAFAEELKTEITLYLEDFQPSIQNFMVSSDTVTDLNMRIHDCANVAEYILTVPSGMVLQAFDANIHNQSEEDMKTAQLLSVGAIAAIFREAEVD